MGALLAIPFMSGFGSVFIAGMKTMLGATLGSIVGTAATGAAGAVFGGAVANVFQGQNPFDGAGATAIAGAATGVFFNASVFQPLRDGISAITNPVYRTAEGVIRYAAKVVDIATYGYAGKAFNAFQGVWNYFDNRAFDQARGWLQAVSDGKKYGANIFKSSSPWVQEHGGVAVGTNVVVDAGLTGAAFDETVAHELSHVFQNQILGPAKYVVSSVFTAAAYVPAALNPVQLGSRSAFSQSVRVWKHALDPREHAIQSYKGGDL